MRKRAETAVRKIQFDGSDSLCHLARETEKLAEATHVVGQKQRIFEIVLSLQARLLHGLTLKYLSSDPHWRRPDEEQLEHDVHDIDYLTVGMHARCFACNESTASYKKLGWRFKFLCPEGRVLQTAAP